MTVYLLRHAKAGSREAWEADDSLRPLSKPGRRQAKAIADALAHEPITRIVSSPSVRCRQTVEPLAGRLHIAVDLSDALLEGALADESLVLFEKVVNEDSVLCSHGDVISNVLWHFQRQGLRLEHDRLEKGSIWALDTDGGVVVEARYIPPPK